SFNDGDDWQPLRLNMPVTSIRDLVVKGDDLVVATHGRGFWILDDIQPLREVTDALVGVDVHLFAPQTALRIRWNTNSDTPMPPDEPRGEDPPDGAIIDYLLKAGSEVTIEILDGGGKVVRRFSSGDRTEPVTDDGNVPRWWIRPARRPSSDAGLHRFVWDLHWPAPAALEGGYSIAAVPRDTPKEPRGPWALPGQYTVRLTAAGRSLTRPLTVRMDPRVKTPEAGLRQQFALSQRLARRIGLFDATMVVMGGIVGSGIFVTPAIVASLTTTSAEMIGAWLLGGVVALLGAFVYAALSRQRPFAGGQYVYLREAWHPA